MSILYSYDADTQHAKVFSRRGDGTVLCDVTGVDLYVGNLLSRLAEEADKEGYERGRKHALDEVMEQLERKRERG